MKTSILLGVMLVVGSLFWSCNSEQLLPNDEEEMLAEAAGLHQEIVGLKSGVAGFMDTGDPQSFPVLHKSEEVGTMKVMHSPNSLIVLFLGNQSHSIDRVQLWVGTDINEIPTNRVSNPTPGRFPFKNFGFNNFIFLIPQDQIADGYYLSDGCAVLLTAHVEVTNRQTGESESAWSEGETFSPKSNATYTEFVPSPPALSTGCFPFPAYCGSMVNKTFYVEPTDVDQKIVAKIGENNWLDIGALSFDSGNFIFKFDQEWMFTDLVTPELVITGYNNPGESGQIIYSGAPQFPDASIFYFHYGPVEAYNYYTVELNVQYCY